MNHTDSLKMLRWVIAYHAMSLSCCLLLPADLSHASWKRIESSSLDCSKSLSLDFHSDCDQMEATYETIPYDTPTEVVAHGFLCHKFILETICSENFFGQQSIQRKTYPTKIGVGECFDKLSEFRRGDSINDSPLEHPLPDCNWMKVRSTFSKGIKMEPHQVTYNVYDRSYISEIFLRGVCQHPLCKTISDSSTWIHSPAETICKPLVQYKGTFWVHQKKGRICGYENEAGLKIDFDNYCEVSYCGHKGIMNEKGIFLKMDIANLYHRPHCDTARVLRHIDSRLAIQEVQLSEKVQLAIRSCQLARQVISDKKSLNSEMLGYFHPITPGVFPMYKYENETLYETVVPYLEEPSVLTTDSPVDEGEKTKRPKNRTVRIWNQAFQQSPCRQDIYLNGIRMDSLCNPIIPFSITGLNYEQEEGLIMRNLIDIARPEEVILKRQMNISKMSTGWHSSKFDPGNYSWGWKNWKSILGMTVGAILILSCCCCFLFRRKGKRSTSRPVEIIPLRTINSKSYKKRESDW